MKVLVDAIYRVEKERYDRTKPQGVDFVKFTIDFDKTGPREHEEVLVERVRQACERHGKDFKGRLANVVVGLKTGAATRPLPDCSRAPKYRYFP